MSLYCGGGVRKGGGGGETASLIGNSCLSMAARSIVLADPSLRNIYVLPGRSQ